MELSAFVRQCWSRDLAASECRYLLIKDWRFKCDLDYIESQYLKLSAEYAVMQASFEADHCEHVIAWHDLDAPNEEL